MMVMIMNKTVVAVTTSNQQNYSAALCILIAYTKQDFKLKNKYQCNRKQKQPEAVKASTAVLQTYL